MVMTSVAYFAIDRSGSTLRRRLGTAAHGMVAALLFGIAVTIQSVSPIPRPEAAKVFFLLWLIPIGLVIASFVWYRGPRIVHTMQLLNVPAMLWSAFVGYIVVAVVAF